MSLITSPSLALEGLVQEDPDETGASSPRNHQPSRPSPVWHPTQVVRARGGVQAPGPPDRLL